MKTLLVSTIIIVFIGCSDNKNKLMTKLINEQKEVQQLYDHSKSMHDNYNEFFEDNTQPDIAKKMRFADTVTKYYGAMLDAEKKLKKITFSIDSLSKMK